MKKLVVLGVIAVLLVSLFLSACGGKTLVSSSTLPSPTSTEAPDDIVITPGGSAYRANVHQQGVPDKWPPVQTIDVTLNDFNIEYRASIETKAGEIRNNIIFIWGKVNPFSFDSELTLYSSDVPDGIVISDADGGGRPGILLGVLAIKVNPDVPAGQYSFKIGIVIDSKDYGTIPCIIKVVK